MPIETNLHVTLLYTARRHICLANESFDALIFMLKSEQELRKHCVLGFAVGVFLLFWFFYCHSSCIPNEVTERIKNDRLFWLQWGCLSYIFL